MRTWYMLLKLYSHPATGCPVIISASTRRIAKKKAKKAVGEPSYLEDVQRTNPRDWT